MKFPYHVKHNGIDYEPFEEIDMGEKSPVSAPEVNEVTDTEEAKVETVMPKRKSKKDKE